jgi:hypothetical protein
MKRKIAVLVLLALALTGCSSLLERSYSVVEPYSDRYWESQAEDILKAESYQDLVNSLLLLVDQRSEEGVIRYYGDEDSYILALNARQEVRQETALGSYLIERVSVSRTKGESYDTLTYRLTYRQDAEDPDALMTLSDSQSLVDLLRLTVREEHSRLTARFAQDLTGEAVTAAVDQFWQEVCDSVDADGQETEEETEYPPCPWRVKCYPSTEQVEIVEIILQDG